MSNPIIIVTSDAFLLSRELKALAQKHIDPATADFNVSRFSAKSDAVDTILDAASMLPMMSEKRVVFVSEAEAFKKDDLAKLKIYFDNPVSSTVLILSATKIDKRLKTWQGAAKKGWVKELKLPYLNQLPPWLDSEAKKMGLKLSPQANQHLVESLGLNLMGLVNALEKLALYIHPNKNIELQHVEDLIGDFLAKNIFDLATQVGARNFKKASFLVSQMATKGEPFVRILFMIARHFRMLLLAQEGTQKRLDERSLAGQLGVHPFFVKDYVTQARQIPTAKLKSIYHKTLACDRSLKSSPLSSQNIMNGFLMEVCLH